MKRVMHIDTSKRFFQKGDTAIAFKMIETGEHKGIVISNKLKRELDRDLTAQEDYSRAYAICIFYLIKDEFNNFDSLIICNDEHYVYVKAYLDLLFRGVPEYFPKEITCISEFRKIMGNNKLKSFADNVANIYRKKGLKSIQRRQKGTKLNIVNINYKLFKLKWIEIDTLLK